jgi:6-phosphogluconolactonase
MDTLNGKRGTVNVCKDADELGLQAARAFVDIVAETVGRTGQCTVALSGGQTPHLMYEHLLESDFGKRAPWDKVHFFIGDERCVAAEDPENNFGNAREQFLNRLNIPASHLHPTYNQEKDPAASAAAYEKTIKQFFGLKDGEFPRFDLVHLGMGPDGHCASLFPGTKALTESKRIVVENFVEKLSSWRITFTIPTINHAANVMFMIQGEDKSEVLAEVLESDVVAYPAQHIVPEQGKLQWFIDRAAARDMCSAPTNR